MKSPNPIEKIINEEINNLVLPTNENDNNLNEEDYRGQSLAPTKDDSPMHDVTDTFGEDMYTGNARRMFGRYFDYDWYSINLIQKARNKPDMQVKIYRAVPLTQTKIKINSGDWVTINPAYAKEHGQSNLNNKFKIITKTVKAKNLFTDGNSIHEWGYVENGLNETFQNLDEGYREIQELSMLADDIINYFSKQNAETMFAKIKQDGELTKRNILFPNVSLKKLSSIVEDLSKYTRKIQDFITVFNVKILFNPYPYRGGSYNSSIQLIKINYPHKKYINAMHTYKVINFDNTVTDEVIDNPVERMKKIMHSSLKDTIIHELQHAYDSYRSNDKYGTDKKSKEYYSARKKERSNDNDTPSLSPTEIRNIYLNLPHEYWARFSQTVYNMYINKPFDEVLKDFKIGLLTVDIKST